MRFRLLGVPITVEWWFWIVAAVLAGSRRDPNTILIWIAVVFVSVLIHEFGHAWASMRLGAAPQIRLTAFGGLTSWRPKRPIGPRERLLVSLAGPAAGFVVGLAALYLVDLPRGTPGYVHVLYHDLIWVNIGWGVINLLPILPMDGGHAMRDIIELLRGGPNERLALKISAIAAALMAFLAFSVGMIFAAILLGWMAFSSWSSMRNLHRL